MKTASFRRSLLLLAAASVAALGGLFAMAPAAHADTAARATPAPAASAPVLALPLPSFAPLAESVKAAVVNVEVASRGHSTERNEMFEQFFGGGQHPQVRQGAGSGFIIDSRGYVLTNNHVVEGAVSIRVKLDDGRIFDGQVLGTDPATDVALVKLKNPPANLAVLEFGDSDAMRVGDWVVAIGNPFGLASSVSVGILSAKARNIGAGIYDDFLQTHAIDYLQVNHKTVASDDVITRFFSPNEVQLTLQQTLQRFDLDGLRGRLLSSSYVPKEGAAAEKMLQELPELFSKYAEEGQVVVEYETKIYYGHLTS